MRLGSRHNFRLKVAVVGSSRDGKGRFMVEGTRHVAVRFIDAVVGMKHCLGNADDVPAFLVQLRVFDP